MPLSDRSDQGVVIQRGKSIVRRIFFFIYFFEEKFEFFNI